MVPNHAACYWASDYLGVRDAMLERLVIQEIEHILNCERKSRAAMGYAEYCLEEIVYELLEGKFRRKETREINFRDHFVSALFAFPLVSLLLANQMPNLREQKTVRGSNQEKGMQKKPKKSSWGLHKRPLLKGIARALGKEVAPHKF